MNLNVDLLNEIRRLRMELPRAVRDAMVKNGMITINEARQLEGLDPLSGSSRGTHA